jgi:hypothetical protein
MQGTHNASQQALRLKPLFIAVEGQQVVKIYGYLRALHQSTVGPAGG